MVSETVLSFALATFETRLWFQKAVPSPGDGLAALHTRRQGCGLAPSLSERLVAWELEEVCSTTARPLRDYSSPT